MAGKLERDVTSIDTAKYFYCNNSIKEYLFCILRGQSKITVYFCHEVLDYFFLSSKTCTAVYIVLKNGVVGLKFSHDIHYSFKSEYLVFPIHSLDLFDELVDTAFFCRGEINCGITLENSLFGLGISAAFGDSAEYSFLNKIRRLPFFALVSFLICDNENKFYGINKLVVKNNDFRNYLELKNKDFKSNMRNVMAFYLDSPQQSAVVFSGNALKRSENVFFVFFFASYIFYENNLYHMLLSFHGDVFLSVLRMRKCLNFYINNLMESKNFLTAKHFYSELEEFGFFIGDKCFLFFHLNKYYRSKKLNDDFFLLKEKCFAANIRKYNISIDRDWGIALLRGACMPIEYNGKYRLVVYPDAQYEILFEHKAANVSVAMSEKEIDIVYDFPMLEKIIVIISPFRIRKIYKNGEYVPLIVGKNNDCIEINSGLTGNITVYTD
ncbi:MAG: hypothetical protein J1G30_09555 [Spirochaetales bacterium]|nr:hypothetical protein [Spirochaetales bacterium]